LLENYKQADLKAISEIANALNIIKQDTKNEQLSKKQLQTKRKDFNIEKIRYKYGTKSKTDYLEDKSSLLEQEQITMTTKAIRLVDYLTLYKAVGGQL
ncbi:TolC family protein, partial [bacterium]|nr:TolC family protein [bacterium]